MKQRCGKQNEIKDLAEGRLSEITTAKYKLTRLGNAIRLDDNFPQTHTTEGVSFEASLLERFWDLNTQLPDRAFSLRIKAFDGDADLYFLEIEDTCHGVYLKGRDFADGLELFGFDRLAIQLPDAPILGLTGEIISGIILPGGSPVIGNFVDWSEAAKQGNWKLLDNEFFLPVNVQFAGTAGRFLN